MILGIRLRLARDGDTGCCSQVAHRVIGGRVRCSDAAVLVRIGGDVCDELLSGECEETREALVGLWWRGETGFGEVKVGDRVGDLGRGCQ